ncbi:hypothetical protein M201_gp66 [Haloarcula californiae tailed virus 2]|uniref:Uncharacterized protein n=1 Tax=Haloarcula californiae tailed virus 2 TaxID=1273747 RepID=R4TA69_9CAUD|nr:hypothetical protein M201_gp66 [Haloarcula californiae tailed virus 2]AGM11835.1 hypothetical protein HCTV2_66 [Haloarcula californiae tailed virus 2]
MDNSAVGWLALGYLLALPTGLAWLVVGPRWALHVLTAAAVLQVIWLQVNLLQEVRDSE